MANPAPVPRREEQHNFVYAVFVNEPAARTAFGSPSSGYQGERLYLLRTNAQLQPATANLSLVDLQRAVREGRAVVEERSGGGHALPADFLNLANNSHVRVMGPTSGS